MNTHRKDKMTLEQWKAQAEEELQEQGHTPEQIKTYSICENGDVYFNRGSIYDYETRAVKPFTD